jgi:hypothetical protein
VNNERQQKPAHESIVDLILGLTMAGDLTLDHMPFAGAFLLRTTFPQNHDAIIKAWETQCHRFGYDDTTGVVASLRAQKDALAASEQQTLSAPPALESGRGSPSFARQETPPATAARWQSHPTVHDGGSAH